MKLLERFRMIECKSLATPMEMNFKNLFGEVAGPDLVNPSKYKQLIGALMFLVNTHPDILCSEHIDSIYEQASPCTLGRYQTHSGIFSWNDHPRFEIYYHKYSNSWIYRCRLGKKRYGWEKYV